MTAGFVDPRQVRRHFARVAAGYGGGADFLSREIDRRMLERLDFVQIEPGRIVDVGCSQGASRESLQGHYPQAQYLGMDLVPEMLQAASRPGAGWRRWLPFRREAEAAFVAADASRLPLKPGCAGLVWSNLLLHWLDDPLPALAEIHRVLEVDGLLMFSTFGPDTLKELRAAFGDGYAHTQRFIDMHDLGDMLVACGFADPVMDMEIVTLTYDSFDAMVGELRAAGATCAMRARRHGLTGRRAWEKVRAAYESLRVDGKLPATFEVVYGHAWKAQPRKTTDGRSVIRFDRPSKK
ncbi:MAG TPA: methyltransferase domain-containing protein [Rhodocyclaceae bacterium]|nr:methyltransferase domain-containing protein [Rhodocyclaceae bacterium]